MTLREKFLKYLEKDARKKDANERERIADLVETKLTDFLLRYIDEDFDGIEAQTDPNYYRWARNRTFSNAKAMAANKAEGELYTMSMKLYMEFLSSKTFKGEEKVTLSNREKLAAQKKKPMATTTTTAKPDPLMPDDGDTMTEGKIRQVNLTRHERNSELRQACLRHYGYVCQVCGMDFERFYGEAGRQFIEVHHLDPIAETDGEHALDPKTGLVPLCSNCHSMIHRNPAGKPYTMEEMRKIYKGPRWNEL